VPNAEEQQWFRLPVREIEKIRPKTRRPNSYRLAEASFAMIHVSTKRRARPWRVSIHDLVKAYGDGAQRRFHGADER
jgi:hypothetical protein